MLKVRQSLVQLAEKMENGAQGTGAVSEAVKEVRYVVLSKKPCQFPNTAS